MKKGNLTREQAIQQAGIDVVKAVEAKNCDFTNRVQTDGDTAVEFSASVSFIDLDPAVLTRTLTAYYYHDADAVEAAGELDQLCWVIEGYEIY
jgi:hypothetical protein